MSLIRQIWLLLLGAVLIAFAGAMAVNVTAARDVLETQLRLKNSDNATALALVLSQQKGDPALMELAMASQFDTGFYRRIRLVGADGSATFAREGSSAPLDAPDWFVALLPIDSVPGVAQVSDGWRALGRVEVESHASFAHDELWHASLRSALALGVLAVLAGLVGSLFVGRIRRPLERTVEQAQAIERGEYPTVEEPQTPELRRLARAMNSMVGRLKMVFEAQATQVETLRRQANCDTLTGLSNRGHFMGQLQAALHREDGAVEGGLVLLRVLNLGEINRSIGHAATDRMLGTIAQALQAYTSRVRGCFVGRLNGSDFALALPVGGFALETAQAITEALRAVLPAFGKQVAVAAGAVEMRHGQPVAELMGAADVALARAEAEGPFSVQAGSEASNLLASLGEEGWRRRLRDALDHGRLEIAEFPVVDAAGRVMHLECPLRLRLQPDGPPEPAARWLPLAVRAHLTAAFDERALGLAIAAIAKDGQPRAINLAPASLLDSGFAGRLRAQLMAAPRAARHVWLEVAESAVAEHFELVRELCRQLRSTGVKLGLEHAGERLGRIERLFELGVDYVKLDGSVSHGIGRDAARAGFVNGLTTMLHSLSLQVIAEGVDDEADAKVLWDCAVDAQTGPWVSAQAPRS